MSALVSPEQRQPALVPHITGALLDPLALGQGAVEPQSRTAEGNSLHRLGAILDARSKTATHRPVHPLALGHRPTVTPTCGAQGNPFASGHVPGVAQSRRAGGNS